MTKRSTMFLNNVTAIDYSYIDETGWVQGGSLNPHFTVSGEIDPVENVVIDFSTVKKIMKEVIDGKETGFDHKLWFVEAVSQGKVIETEDGYRVETAKVTIEVPKNALKVIPTLDESYHIFDREVGAAIEREVAAELNHLYPTANIEVAVQLKPEFIGSSFTSAGMHPFRYVHGLKNSTSWGCQNIAHGHYSYISADTQDEFATNLLLSKIANYFDNAVFIWKENCKETDDNIYVHYETERGKFKMVIDKKHPYTKSIFMNEETTVENIVEMIGKQFMNELLEAGVIDLFVSEGLNKGAVYSLY